MVCDGGQSVIHSKFLMIAAIVAFAVSSSAASRLLQHKAAESFVQTNSVETLFEYLDRTIPTNERPTPDSPLSPEDVLSLAVKNPEFSVRQVRRLLELAQLLVAHQKATPDERASQYELFVRSSVIANLGGDARSIAIAEELNHEIGEEFDQVLTKWSRLSDKQREVQGRLLAISALRSAEPEFYARIHLFAQMATTDQFLTFRNSLSSAAGGVLAEKSLNSASPIPRGLESPRLRFVKWIDGALPLIPRLAGAAHTVAVLKTYKFPGSRGSVSWTIADANRSFDYVYKNGTRRFIEDVLTMIERSLPFAFDSAVNGKQSFAELVHSGEFKRGLVLAEERYPELADRLHSIQDQLVQIDRQIGQSRLDAIVQDHARANAQMRRALNIRVCRDLFGL